MAKWYGHMVEMGGITTKSFFFDEIGGHEAPTEKLLMITTES
jgi:hypothetical protein